MGNIKFYKQARCQNHIYHANYLNYSYPFIEQTDFICMTNNKTALVSIKAVLLITNGGASLPTFACLWVEALSVLIPDLWGESSDQPLRLSTTR